MRIGYTGEFELLSVMDKPEPTRTCKLESGNIEHYDVCADSPHAYGSKFTYIGKGVVWEINGVRQSSDRQIHFFVKA